MTVSLGFNDEIVELAGFDNFRVGAAPEPGGLLLASLGLAAMGLWHRRQGPPPAR